MVSAGRQAGEHIALAKTEPGAVFVEQKIPHTTYFDYLDKFGFNDKTEVDLQGEVSSLNDTLQEK